MAQVSIYIAPATQKRLQQGARKAKKSVSQLVQEAIVKSELILGARKRGGTVPNNYEISVRNILVPFEIVAIDEEAAEIYGGMRASLEQA